MKFSVLMSLYIKENPQYLRECFESLVAQTHPADEIVLVFDGAATPIKKRTDEERLKYLCCLPVFA